MARIRSIKPTFWKSRAVRKLSDAEKLVWVGLWNIADDLGRLMDEPSLIAGELWALAYADEQVESALSGLASKGRIIRYTVEDDGFIQITGWGEHQKISNPTASTIPEPLASVSGGLTNDSAGRGRERKGKEGRGIASEESLTSPPEPFCPDHPRGTRSSCRACADARRARTAWDDAQKSRPTPTPRMPKPDDGHEHSWDEHGTCTRCEKRRAA